MRVIEVKTALSEKDKQEAFRIRKIVFVEEQGVSEEIEYDKFEISAKHILASISGTPAGAARVRFMDDGFLKVERMAVLPDFRHHGVGWEILRYCEEIAKRYQCSGLYLHAQLRVKDFYARYGYIEEGEIFKEADIDHIAMRKYLSGNPQR